MSDALGFDVVRLLCRRGALTTNESLPTSVVLLFAAHTDGTANPVRCTQMFQGLLEQLEQTEGRGEHTAREDILLAVARSEMDIDPIFLLR